MGQSLRLRLTINKKNKAIVTSIPKRKLPKSIRSRLTELKWARVSLEGFDFD